jgi:hypothetical protein
MSEPMDLELQIQLDIKGVFDDLFEQDDVIEEDEEEMIAPTDAVRAIIPFGSFSFIKTLRC